MAGSSHFELLFRKNPLPMWVFDLDTLAFLDVNQAAITKYGYSRDEFLSMNLKDIRPPEDVPAFLERTRTGVYGLREPGLWRHIRKDGTLIDVEVTAHDFEWEGRRARLVLANDVTEKKRATEALMEEHNLLRTLIDNMPDHIYIKDASSRFLLANRFCAQVMRAKEADDLIGKTDFDFYPKAKATAYYNDEQAVIRSGQPLINHEESAVDAAGNKWTLTTKVPLRDKQGQVIGIMGIGRDITDRKTAELELLKAKEAVEVAYKEAEKALSEESRLLRTLIDNVPDFIFMKDSASRFLLANKNCAQIMGAKESDELIGKTDFDFYPKEQATAYYNDEQAIIRSGQPLINHEERNVDPAGNNIWLLTTKIPLRDAHGQVVGIMGIGRNITDRKRAELEVLKAKESAEAAYKEAEKALSKESQLLRTLIDNVPDYIYVKDAGGRFVVANRALSQLVGAKNPEELLGKTDFDFFPKELAAAFHSDEQAILKSRESLVNQEERSVDAKGNPKWTSTSKVPLRDNTGNVIGIMGIGRDITMRRQAEEALRESNQALKALVDASPVAIVCVDRAGNVTLANPAAERMFGWSEREMLGRPVPIVPEEQRHLYYALRAAVLEGKSVSGREVQALKKDGSTVDAIVSMAPLRDGAGEIRGAMDIAVDITDRKEAEAQLALQAAALESAANAVVISDKSGKIEWVNPAFTVMTGYSSEEIVGQTFGLLKSGKHPKEFFDQLWDTIRAGKVWHGEIVNRRKDGTLFIDEQTITPVRSEDGEIIRYVTIEQDVSEKRQLAQQLSQSQKMESIGRLAGGVAHDFNNLLTVVLSYGDVLLERTDLDPRTHKQVEEIKKAAVRAATLTRQLLAFSRQQVMEPKILNLNAIITDTEKMLRRLIGEDIELLTRLDADLGSVKVDPGQVEQIVMNLVVNARDAMPEGGRLIIETSNADLDEEYARYHPPSAPGRYVLLTVTDTGVGMDRETKAHIFEPFFTTKELGKGTGLGLSTVYGIVRQSGGYIWVYSEPKQGSVFKIYLPRVEGPAEQVRTSEPAIAHLRGSETILVVEDEEALRTLTCSLLQLSGYTVLEAKSGALAIELARTHASPIHLLLTDVVMPEMSGSKVAEELARLRPEAKVVFMSGYTRFSDADKGLEESSVILLQKPFSRAALLRKVREALDAKPGAKPQ
jgi:PAS domain S-box-containing protein